MVLPGLLIEYLVVGTMAILWVFPLIGIPFDSTAPLAKAVILAPIVYVLGMFIDALAYVLVSKFPLKRYSLKSQIKRHVIHSYQVETNQQNRFLSESGSSTKGTIWVYQHYPEIVKELDSRSSRDRIARGALVNFILMYAFTALERNQTDVFWNSFSGLTWFGLILFSFLVWIALESHSYAFEVRLGNAILENMDNNKS